MEDYAIKVENLSKEFKLPHNKKTSLKQAAIGLVKRDNTYEIQQALKDVSFEIKKGEFFGIVGRNGSGKSTLLKIMAGVYTPTTGVVKVNGSLVPFIELGVGFNPELSGRDNVFLNGALLGFSRQEMEQMYDEIVEFAELERFMDQKLKNYSSGMQVRLAFSIAIKAQGDILILDEVLAVGDAAFQKKCIDVFEKYKTSKKTVILVTHSMDIVEKFCSRALLLENGEVQIIGKPTTIVNEYTDTNLKITKDDLVRKDRAKIKSKIQLKIKDYNAKGATFNCNDTLQVEVSWPEDIKNVKNVAVAIFKNSGEFIFGSNTLGRNLSFKDNKVNYEAALPLGPGKYHLVSRLFGETRDDIIERLEGGPEFMVIESSDSLPKGQQNGLVRLKHEWRADR